MWHHHEWVEVEALYVDESWRGRGLAETLLDHACDWANSIGEATVQLLTANGTANALYPRKADFAVVRR